VVGHTECVTPAPILLVEIMSITFYSTQNPDGINLSNSNAHALLNFIEVPFDYCGEIEARELAVACGRNA
jgi:hypothetical protein